MDFISTQPLPTEAEKRVIDNLVSAIEDFDVVLVSDQAETAAGGVVTPAVRDSIIELAGRHASKVFLVDSRKRVHLFRKVMVKPNRAEAEAACEQLFGTVDFRRLREHLGARAVMVTHGPQGALVVEEGKETWAKARPVENPVDICGAGDSFAAGTALTMAVTGDPVAAAGFGNLVASITVMKKGTGTASPEEVIAGRESRPLSPQYSCSPHVRFLHSPLSGLYACPPSLTVYGVAGPLTSGRFGRTEGQTRSGLRPSSERRGGRCTGAVRPYLSKSSSSVI